MCVTLVHSIKKVFGQKLMLCGSGGETMASQRSSGSINMNLEGKRSHRDVLCLAVPVRPSLRLREYWAYSVNGHRQGWTLGRLTPGIGHGASNFVFSVTQRCRRLEGIGR